MKRRGRTRAKGEEEVWIWGAVTLAMNPCALGCGHLPRSTKSIPPSTTLSRLAREAQVEKMKASWMVEGKGTKGYRQIIQDKQPNTGQVHQMEPDGSLHHPVGATNQLLYVSANQSTCPQF